MNFNWFDFQYCWDNNTLQDILNNIKENVLDNLNITFKDVWYISMNQCNGKKLNWLNKPGDYKIYFDNGIQSIEYVKKKMICYFNIFFIIL